MNEELEDWDKFLPYFLFAYRDVPQESTGFSPFELMYGRNVNGPLDIIANHWLKESGYNDSNLVQYVLDHRERVGKTVQAAVKNIEKAQIKQKLWYDKKARDRQFNIGDQVLMLTPFKGVHSRLCG
jgi:hypothetical protein